jgi:Erg28 like protein
MAMWTYCVALFHFGMEWFYYKTTRMGAPLLGPAVVSVSGLLWMSLQWGYYVK